MVVEQGCDSVEVVNIRSALASIYKQKCGLIGDWKILPDCITAVYPVNSIMANESLQYY